MKRSTPKGFTLPDLTDIEKAREEWIQIPANLRGDLNQYLELRVPEYAKMMHDVRAYRAMPAHQGPSQFWQGRLSARPWRHYIGTTFQVLVLMLWTHSTTGSAYAYFDGAILRTLWALGWIFVFWMTMRVCVGAYYIYREHQPGAPTNGQVREAELRAHEIR